jgi:hypothetical protein
MVRCSPAQTLAIGVLAGLLGCSENVTIGSDDATGGLTGTGGIAEPGGAGGVSGAGGVVQSAGGICQTRDCLGKVYACGNCMDDDGDGLVDAADPDCLGPCDNTEDSYFGGIPGQNNAPCRQDCYFDQDSGSGNDGCDWTQACDPLSIAPAFPPSGNAQCTYDPGTTLQGQSCADLSGAEPQSCLDFCLPLTPNGCDCFGCCELPARSGHFVWLGSSVGNAGSCTADSVNDPSACKPCTPVPSCFNACEPCEICVGTSAPDPSCTGGAACSVGIGPCAPGAICPSDSYCVTGCCIAVPR